ncbi:acyltransferase [Shewanella fodinae]|uniref:Acetyltransferase-like isoleucine patch superfamily enzyme n=1 Tax=Shewanella fodinae TaxID=552357 RepID=A0A4R2F2K3_9GAMM|nr:acyltransferase [Shewanella fodinae]TCN77396.1 acetyltransferase-like isoleucine patch superfamily enzyme [Shewanella fodinae]
MIFYFYKKIRGRELVLDKNLSNVDIMIYCISFLIMYIRGVVYCYVGVFLGKGVCLRGVSKLKLGKGTKIGRYCTIDAIGTNGIVCGRAFTVGEFSTIKVSGSLCNLGKGIIIGDNVGIGEFAHIGGAGGLIIGDDTIIGSYFSAHPENHIFHNQDILIRNQGVTHQGISIGKNCWIGAKVTLLDGAIIGDRCVIAAGAVVKGQFPSGCVIGGIPAKVLKTI